MNQSEKETTDLKLDSEMLTFNINGGKCSDKKSLLNEFSIQLKFPDYFGSNWDAFDECICDLDWFDLDKYKGIIVLVNNSNALLKDFPEDRKILNDIIEQSGEYWNNNKKAFHILLK